MDEFETILPPPPSARLALWAAANAWAARTTATLGRGVRAAVQRLRCGLEAWRAPRTPALAGIDATERPTAVEVRRGTRSERHAELRCSAATQRSRNARSTASVSYTRPSW